MHYKNLLLPMAMVASLAVAGCGDDSADTGTTGSAAEAATFEKYGRVPVITLSTSPSTIGSGGSSNLSWTAAGATTCAASGAWSGTLAVSGTRSVKPTVTSGYTLTCRNSRGRTSRSTAITVTAAPPAPAPTTPAPVVTLDSSALALTAGGAATLTWSSTNATSCVASGAWTGTKGTSGLVSVSPAATSSYALACTGAGGTGVDDVTITVTAAPAPPTTPTTPVTSDVSAIGTECANKVYVSGIAAVLGQDTRSGVVSPTPAKGTPVRDANYGTCVVRATDRAAEAGSPGFLRNDYSRRQAFNANSTMFLTYALNGAWQLYDASTLKYLRALPGVAGDAEPQWDPVNPNLLYYVPTNGGTALYQLDVAAGTRTTVGSFAGRLPWAGAAHIWTKSEGSPSADARYWCFMADDASFSSVGVFVWDKATDTIMGTLSTAGRRPDHVSMSPSGRHCVVSWLDETVAFTPQMVRERVVHTTSEHSDIALGLDGADYYVAVDYQANSGDVFMVNLDTGVRTSLFPTYFGDGSTTALHFSGKAYANPGWVVVSTYAGSGPRHWLHDKVFIVELKANPRIVNLAHHKRVNSSGWSVQDGNYWTEPQASVNRDMTRVVFNSNWSVASAAPENYMVVLPSAGFLP